MTKFSQQINTLYQFVKKNLLLSRQKEVGRRGGGGGVGGGGGLEEWKQGCKTGAPGGYDAGPLLRGASTAGDLQIFPHQIPPGGLLTFCCSSVHQALGCRPVTGQHQIQLVVPCPHSQG